MEIVQMSIVDEWINKMWYMSTREYYPVTKEVKH